MEKKTLCLRTTVMMLLMLLTTVSAWAQYSCTLTLDDNYDGGGCRTLPPIEKGSTVNLTKLAPTRTGHTFYGWSNTPKGLVDYQPTSSITVDNDMTLYAVWENRIINGMIFEYDQSNSESVILAGVSGDLADNLEIPSSVTIEGKDYTVTRIGEKAFATRQMQSVTIPASVWGIGDNAFDDCYELTSVTICATAVPILGEDVFRLTPAKIYVYSYLVDSYKNAEHWSKYADKIEAITPVARGTCGKQNANGGKDVSWEVVEVAGNKRLLISGTGDMKDFPENSSAPWNGYRADITSVFIGNGVTSIGDYAFQDYDALTSISVSNSVTSIGRDAFSDCNNLATVTLNSNPLIVPYAFPATTTVTMNLTPNASVWNWWMTFYNRNYSFTVDGKTTIYKGKVNGNSVQLTEVGLIPAGNAVILKSTSSSITLTLTTTKSANFTDNDLKGADLDIDASSITYAYCLSNGANGVGFYKYTGNGVNGLIPANRAYLVIPGSNNAPAYNFLGFDEDNDEATQIKSLAPALSEGEGAIYDLSGRKVNAQPNSQFSILNSQLKKGLYIVNGKKVFIK